MKNFFKIFGVIAVVAIIGIGLAGCDNGSTTEDPPPAGSGKITVTNDTMIPITGIWIGRHLSSGGGLTGFMSLVGSGEDFEGSGQNVPSNVTPTPVSVSIGHTETYTSPLVSYKYTNNQGGYKVKVIIYTDYGKKSKTVTGESYEYPTTLAFKASEF
jgi:hypothetical protein